MFKNNIPWLYLELAELIQLSCSIWISQCLKIHLMNANIYECMLPKVFLFLKPQALIKKMMHTTDLL